MFSNAEYTATGDSCHPPGQFSSPRTSVAAEGETAAGLRTVASQQASAAQRAPAANDELATLRAEIERLKSIVPGQAFAMTQIAYNFNNLWFAAHAENWPLAQFYYNETRTRLRWALRITPVRKISSGDLELQVPTAPAEPMICFAPR